MARDRRRKASEEIDPVRSRKTVILSAEAIQRLGVASVRESCDESDIVEMLINTHLSGYVLQVRGARIVLDRDRQRNAAELSPAAPSAA
jgi:hypothetical protein